MEDYHKNCFKFDKKRDEIWKVIARYLQKYIPKNSKVLDLGAGYASFINNINASEKHAVDIWGGLIKHTNADVKAHIITCTDLSILKKNYFDVVFSSNLLEHLEIHNVIKTIDEIKNILKPEGVFIIIQPNYKYCKKVYFEDPTHKTIFTDESLSNLLKEKGFKIKKIIPKFLPFSMKSKAPKSKLLLKLYLKLPIRPLAKQMLIICKK